MATSDTHRQPPAVHPSTDAPTPTEEAADKGRPLDQSGVFEPGTLFGVYRILQLLGEGGMGRVYMAEHARLGRKVALKVLRKEHTQNPGLLQRFFTEARAVNQINHEHIVEITDFCENEDGYSYYIMELLRGQNLGALLAGGALTLERTLSIALQTCQALEAVHKEGFIHRDLKPDNIFLTEKWGQRDFVKLLDFGIVKLAEQPEGADLNNTSPGAIVGTPAFMSPEQASGKPVDHRSDLYSLGIILYQMISGKRPIEAKSYGEYVIKHLTVKPIRPSKLKTPPNRIPPHLDDLVMACLEKDPDSRPQSAQVILQKLAAIAQEEKCDLEQFVPTQYVAPPRARSRTWLVLISLAALALMAAAGLGILLLEGTLNRSDERPDAMGRSHLTKKKRTVRGATSAPASRRVASPPAPEEASRALQPKHRRSLPGQPDAKGKVPPPPLTGTMDPFK